ncbi:oligo-1,6-glucosidase [Murinocardiopsis flavida]|uniref:Oligo-1,6-glucosidase n=1 Tax=Murinocardiopsis flavida TaxID=645275 RepID=A0A2P8CB87_9ACTN|nr:alpha-glucosidase [Murinocardiopsis flavida]PSK82234.1 oligo-1,6-glucosidase [Murinocardiopsis flavida]
MAAERADWWRESVVYQVYPQSFQDSDGDGVGDLPGIIDRLDYLRLLGVDVVWLSPVYPSPGDDNGYDISEYCDINPQFGTLADWDRLRDGLHARGMRLIMDLVVNHTSDAHPWFIESRASRDAPRRDFYIWRDSPDGTPPNNWRSVFSGPAWEHDSATDASYLHLFSRRQPDLNWADTRVRTAVHDIMTWWLDRGADGFRMDVINFISKDPALLSSDAPAVEAGDGMASFAPYVLNGPRVHEYLREMHDMVLAGRGAMTVGEMPGVTVEQARDYTAPQRRELNMVFQFEHMEVDSGPGGKFDPVPFSLPSLKRSLARWQTGLEGHGWNSLYLNNHDQPRSVSRFGSDGTLRVESATMLATSLHMLKGTPFVYQGEELGMTNAHFTAIEDYRDIETLNHYHSVVHSGEVAADEVLRRIGVRSRDNARTPMQWDASPNAGFTTGTPWLAANPNHTEVNAEAAVADPGSVFHYYRRLIRLRKEHPVVVHGVFELLLAEHESLFAYTRTLGHEVLLVLANWSAETVEVPLPASAAGVGARPLLGNYPEPEAFGVLRPFEATITLGAAS